ncbi:AAC(3)-I family aminoglycoside 3-N-acetyltransferase [Alkalicoccus saliphilus]|uniref:AAC(3)-I family aminoglycoside 3-N-acetyltransferase n=1 Tax=Alkalicoccus saliphilus TaxID=200989 RepID=A0A2T4U3T4_9BACI|nr:AAC(3)-I family aminoglycoside 3-N-acetyltransferase [Alkalicoccus saliphilus]
MSITFQRLKSTSRGLKQVRELNELYAEAFDEKEMYLENKPSDEYVLKQLAKKDIIVCTALSGEQVVAGLTAYVMDKLERETCEIYIYDLAVDAKFRRKKIATHLLEFLIKEAQKLEASAVFIQAEAEDEPAVALYESMGEREVAYHYDIYIKEKW